MPEIRSIIIAVVEAGVSEECESKCLNNCSCAAYAYNSSGFFVWSGELLNLQQLSQDDSNGQTLFLKLAASEFHVSKSNEGTPIGIVAGAVGGTAVLLVECGRLKDHNLQNKKIKRKT